MVRDLCAFIAVFLFLVSCFYMVIGKGVEVRKYIVKILIFAVMINFSFPISKAILDFSNIFALNIYGSVTDYKYKENAKNGVLWDDYGLSYQIAQVIGLQEPVTQSGDVNPNTSVLTGIDGTFTILGLIVMIMALAVVFAQATALFMTRTALMFLAIITSPIMFMGGILPGNSPINIAIDWWIKKFFGGAFLAPVMIINLALALQMMRFTMSLPASAGFLPGGDSLIKLVMMMLTIVIFQKAVEYSAKMLDGIGEKAAAIGGRVGGKMMSAGFARPAAAITRSTLGRGVSALMDRSTKSGGWLSQTSTRNGPIGNMARATLKTIDTGNQRLRNSSMNALGGAVKMASFGKIDNIVTEQGGIERDILEKEKNQVERQQRVEDNKAARNATLAEKTAKDSNEAFDKAERLKAESKEHEEDADKKTLVLEDLETERKGKLIEIEELENRKENIKSSPAYVIKMADHQKAKTLLESQNTKALWENDTEAIKKIKEEKKKLDAALLLYQDEAGIVEINKDLSEDYTRLDKINKSIAKINKEKVAVTKMAEQARAKSEKSHYAGIDAAGASIAAAEQAVEAKARSEALAPDVNRYREAFKVYATADKTADRNSLSPEALLGVAMTKPKKPDQMTQILEAIKKQASQNKEKGKEKEKEK